MISESRLNLLVTVLLIAVPLGAYVADQPYVLTLATRVVILGMAAVGLNLVLGFGGLVSFGHAAYFGAGGYVAGILAHHALSKTPIIEFPFVVNGTAEMLIIWPVAMAVGALLAFLIGALSLATRGVYFIMITLAFAQMLYFFAISWPAYGGEDGLPTYIRSGFPGLNTMMPLQYFGTCLCLLFLVIWLMSRLVASHFGMALRATHENPLRAASVGVEVFRTRLTAFIISGAITALAGALFTDLHRFVSPTMFSWHMSGEIIVFVILGGVGRLYGPVVGAACFVMLEQVLGGFTEHWQFWLGIGLVMVVLFAKGGIVGLLVKEKPHA